MIDLKSLGYITIIDIIIKIIFDSIYTKKIIKEICDEPDNLGDVITFPVKLSALVGTIIVIKLIILFILFIVCLFVFDFKLFSLNSLLMIFIFALNEIISRKLIYESHMCEFLKN